MQRTPLTPKRFWQYLVDKQASARRNWRRFPSKLIAVIALYYIKKKDTLFYLWDIKTTKSSK